MALKILLLGMTVICSCNSSYKLTFGEYKCKEYGFLGKMIKFIKNDQIIVGNRFYLNSDSTFILKTCSNIFYGNWVVKHDTLITYLDSNFSIRDSAFLSINDSIIDLPDLYLIKNKNLIHYVSSPAKKKSIKLVYDYVKN